MRRLTRTSLLAALAVSTVACTARREPAPRPLDPLGRTLAMAFPRRPDTIPTRWRGLIGEYGPDTTLRWYALERDGRLYILDHYGNYVPLGERYDSTIVAVFDAPMATAAVSGEVRFYRDSSGRASGIALGDMVMQRRAVEPPPGAAQLRITPVRPIDELRREALAATPPAETGAFLPPDLVPVTSLDSTIRLDVRYASDNNFLGTPLYEEARAYLQRPAAQALVRANAALRSLGYTIQVFDAYRPWYVTRLFWDATPEDKKWLVANPAQGSKHNRGAAVDLTLVDLKTGEPVEMPSTYDEATTRAAANYPGGTARQRFHRALLRRAMEEVGFVANPREWWHFDHREWNSYPILNIPFERIGNP